MGKKNDSIIWGISIIAIGIILLGNAINIWNFNLFFKGWWTLFIIVPSIIGLIKGDYFYSNFIFLIIGILLLLNSQNIIVWSMIWKIFIPILLIIIGLNFIFKPKIPKSIKNNNKAEEYFAIFSGNKAIIDNKANNLSAVSIFGGLNIDLTKAKIEHDIVIESVSVFGGVDIKLPNDVNIKENGIPLFGGLKNNFESNKNDNKHTIYINYVCVFGGINLK